MNGTIWTGATQIGTTTALSNTINFTGIALPDPCHPITWTPVRSLTDPGYTPLRITDPVGGSLIVPSETDGSIIGTLTKVDVTFDAENMNQTMEMVNTQTGFSAGVQTIISRITGQLTFYSYPWSFITQISSPDANQLYESRSAQSGALRRVFGRGVHRIGLLHAVSPRFNVLCVGPRRHICAIGLWPARIWHEHGRETYDTHADLSVGLRGDNDHDLKGPCIQNLFPIVLFGSTLAFVFPASTL
ncbi:hypothetical protein FB451DRAFT_1407682 [Mycena latifolia]|nr:hypothetical protein FB451DRAFT_1407682 [Mycena latifolia]